MTDQGSYVAAVVCEYLEMPETPRRASQSDQSLAGCFFHDGIPLWLVQAALRLGSLRRLRRPPQAPPLTPIRSLAYFRPVVEELLLRSVPQTYADYLRVGLRRAIEALPAKPTKNTFFDDR